MSEGPNIGSPQIVRRAFGDFDDLAESQRGVEILRQTKGPCRAELTRIQLGAVTLARWFHALPLIVNATVGPQHRVFFVRFDGDAPVLVNGHALDEHRLLDHRPGTEIRIATRSGVGVRLLKIIARPPELDRVCCSVTGRAFSSGPGLCTLLEPESGTLSALRSVCATTLAAGEAPVGTTTAESAAALGEAVLRAVVSAVGSDPQRQKGHDWAGDFHSRVVQRADRILRANPGEHVPLSVLSTAIGVNQRQLQRAFRAVYALSPFRYRKLRRLHLARSALRGPSLATTVTDVAMSLGFRDLGRFASAYSELFGESPSVTLARARGGLSGRGQPAELPQAEDGP
jgi:AraC family transcriptional regulator, ethanolamine operon transcriptional activator